MLGQICSNPLPLGGLISDRFGKPIQLQIVHAKVRMSSLQFFLSGRNNQFGHLMGLYRMLHIGIKIFKSHRCSNRVLWILSDFPSSTKVRVRRQKLGLGTKLLWISKKKCISSRSEQLLIKPKIFALGICVVSKRKVYQKGL